MVIEDDITLKRQIAENLSRWDYQVFCSENFREILPEFIEGFPIK